MHGRRRTASLWSETSVRKGALSGVGSVAMAVSAIVGLCQKSGGGGGGGDGRAFPRQGEGVCAGPRGGPGVVTGVVCNLCDKKGIPCQWGKVSIPTLLFFFCLLIFSYRKQPAFGLAWAVSKPGPSAMWGV